MTDNSIDTADRPYFSPQHEASHKLCVAADKEVSEQQDTVLKLLDALQKKPSNMLAYHLLAEHYESSGDTDAAAICRKNTLPPQVHCHLESSQGLGSSDSGTVASDLKLVDRQVLYPDEVITLPSPEPLSGGLSGNRYELPRFFSEPLIKAKPCFIDRIANGVLWHDSFHTLVCDAQHCEITAHTKADTPLIHSIMKEHEPIHFKGRLFLIGARGAHNFYHWMLDIAPKLGVLLQAGFEFSPTDKFVVPFANSDFTRQIMDRFGVAKGQVYESEKHYTYISADELVVPCIDNKMGLTMGKWLPRSMGKYFLQPGNLSGGAVRDNPASGARIFIAREKKSADGRQIENQDDLLQVLERYGFECIYPEEYSVVQQAEIFAQAEVIVAAHGAALANLVFCTAGTRIIEFYAGHIAPCYWAISALCNLKYAHLFCGQQEALTNEPANCQANRSGNLMVPLVDFEQLLDKILCDES